MKTNLQKRIEKIGSREAFLATGIALTFDFVAIIVGTIIEDDFLSSALRHFWIPFAFAIALLTFGQILGKRTALFISRKPRLWWIAGPICAFVTLFATVSICGLLFWTIETIGRFDANSVWIDLAMSTLGVPLGILIYSWPFLTAHGLWFGYRIASRIKKLAVTF